MMPRLQCQCDVTGGAFVVSKCTVKARIAQLDKIARRSPNVGNVRASSWYFEDGCWCFGQLGSGRL